MVKSETEQRIKMKKNEKCSICNNIKQVIGKNLYYTRKTKEQIASNKENKERIKREYKRK
jgi:hypothetical protein